MKPKIPSIISNRRRHKIIVGSKKKKKLGLTLLFFTPSIILLHFGILNKPRKAIELIEILVTNCKFWKQKLFSRDWEAA
jgi:hypothetical protein